MKQLRILRIILWGTFCLLTAALILPILLTSGGRAVC